MFYYSEVWLGFSVCVTGPKILLSWLCTWSTWSLEKLAVCHRPRCYLPHVFRGNGSSSQRWPGQSKCRVSGPSMRVSWLYSKTHLEIKAMLIMYGGWLLFVVAARVHSFNKHDGTPPVLGVRLTCWADTAAERWGQDCRQGQRFFF